MTEFVVTMGVSSLANLFVRATIVLLVALALQWLTHRGPALTRHNLWTLTFAILLVLPVVRLFGPTWDVPVLPEAGGPADEVRLETSALAVEAYATAAATEPAPPARVASASGEALESPPLWGLARLAFLVWATGCGVALASVGVGALRFHKLARNALYVENEAWLRRLEELRKDLAIRTEVRLLQGKGVLTPMTGGIRKPAILLPVSAVDWSDARCRIVLAHELVHVRRRDALRQLVGRAVLALYWFHPLSWVASCMAGARREEACDQDVLLVGVRPSEYAEHLLSLAEASAPARAVLSLPMAHQSRLESRIRAVLRPSRARPGSVLVAAVAALTTVVLAGISVSVVDPVRQETDRYIGAKVANASDREARRDGRLFVAPVLESDLDQELAKLKIAWSVGRHDPLDR
ncbi:MAG: M56 family metallopeptidase [Acidobacteriota bacterium]|nr:M56 family metallopeptidase [Acidobacteriota bacterium]